MELNFESKNIKGGDNTIKLKYYQIFYKVGISFIFYGNCFIIDNSTKYLNPDINDIKKRKTKNKFCIWVDICDYFYNFIIIQPYTVTNI